MAERRMFSRSVVESDSFMCMPADVQMLYLHLNMAADDDGFVANPRTIMRMCGASDDSMKLLIAKKFVLTFEKQDNFVVVIKHWRLNNYIQKDRYRETKYKEFMRELYYDENKSYSLNPNDGHYPCIPEKNPAPVSASPPACIQPVSDMDTECIQGVSKMEPQDRLGKDRVRLEVGEENNNTSISLSESEKSEKIAQYRRSLQTFRRCGYNTQGVYELAAAEGITKEEIDKEDT